MTTNTSQPISLQGFNSPHCQNQAIALGLLGVSLFALTLPFSKIAVQALTGIEIGLLRSLIAGLVALPILWVTRSPLPTRSQIGRLYLGSLGIIYGFPIFSSLAMKYVPVSHGAIVLAILPLMTAVFGVWMSKKAMSRQFWGWAGLGAILVISYVAVSHDLQGMGFGDSYLAIAVLLAGFGYAQSGQLAGQIAGWRVICWMVVLNLPILAGLSVALVDWHHLANLTVSQGVALGYLSLVSALLGFFAWNKALALGGIAKISQLQLLQTFITYAVAVMFMGEDWHWVSVAVAVLVVFCVYRSQKATIQ